MDWLRETIPYISWAAVIIILFVPSSKAKKLKELEHRVEQLEKEVQKSKVISS